MNLFFISLILLSANLILCIFSFQTHHLHFLIIYQPLELPAKASLKAKITEVRSVSQVASRFKLMSYSPFSLNRKPFSHLT